MDVSMSLLANQRNPQISFSGCIEESIFHVNKFLFHIFLKWPFAVLLLLQSSFSFLKCIYMNLTFDQQNLSEISYSFQESSGQDGLQQPKENRKVSKTKVSEAEI